MAGPVEKPGKRSLWLRYSDWRKKRGMKKAARKAEKKAIKDAKWRASMEAIKKAAMEEAARTTHIQETEYRMASKAPPMGGKAVEAKAAVDPQRAALENPEMIKRMTIKAMQFGPFVEACKKKNVSPQIAFNAGVKWLLKPENDPEFWLELGRARDAAEDRQDQADTPEERRHLRFSTTKFCAGRIMEKYLPKVQAKKQ